jgi:hypothetical protein
METGVESHSPGALLQGKIPQYPVNRRLSGLQNAFEKRKRPLHLLYDQFMKKKKR